MSCPTQEPKLAYANEGAYAKSFSEMKDEPPPEPPLTAFLKAVAPALGIGDKPTRFPSPPDGRTWEKFWNGGASADHFDLAQKMWASLRVGVKAQSVGKHRPQTEKFPGENAEKILSEKGINNSGDLEALIKAQSEYVMSQKRALGDADAKSPTASKKRKSSSGAAAGAGRETGAAIRAGR